MHSSLILCRLWLWRLKINSFSTPTFQNVFSFCGGGGKASKNDMRRLTGMTNILALLRPILCYLKRARK